MKSIFDYNPIMHEALTRLQFRVDQASKENVNLFDETWYSKHFKMNTVPHIRGEFATVLGKKHITIAASTINGKSSEPIRMNQGFYEHAQKMFTHAHAFKMTSDEILGLLDVVEIAKKNGDKSAVNYIVDTLLNHTKEAVDGVNARLDLIILSALSNEGVHTITKENDPQSPFVGMSMSFGLPEANKAVVGADKKWYNATAKTWNSVLQSTIDPIVEINDVLKRQRTKIKKILLDEATLDFIMGCDKMKNYVNSVLYPNMPLDINMLNAWMRQHNKPEFEVVYREICVQNGDSISEPIAPWRTGQLVFIPDEQIGTIETKFTEKERGIVDEGVKYANSGRIELRRMAYGERDGGEYYELLKAGITAAPAMDTIDRILTLDTTK